MKKVHSILLLMFAGLVAISARRFNRPVVKQQTLNRRDLQQIRRYPFLGEDYWKGTYRYQINKAKKSLYDLAMEHEKLKSNYQSLRLKLQKFARKNKLIGRI